MNRLQRNARSEAVQAALATVAAELTPEGSSGWRLSFINGAAHSVTARTTGDWLVLEADDFPLAAGPEGCWEALVRNAGLPGPAKIVVSDDGRARVCADLPLLDEVTLETRIGEAFAGFAGAWSDPDNHPAPAETARDGTGPADLKRLCNEAGWGFTERAGGRLAVELEVPGSYYQALLLPEGNGVRISCDLAELDGISEASQLAIAGLLLAASAHLRLGRASVNPSASPPVAQFEVRFATTPCPAEISSSLECLSVACSLCGEEIKALRDPVVAESHLALRGRGGIGGAESNERTAK